MKAIEVSYQTVAARRFLEGLWESGVAAGVSSFGPVMFVITEQADPKLQQITASAERLQLRTLDTFCPRNTGVQIKKVP
jgi:predicted sugar kinase